MKTYSMLAGICVLAAIVSFVSAGDTAAVVDFANKNWYVYLYFHHYIYVNLYVYVIV